MPSERQTINAAFGSQAQDLPSHYFYFPRQSGIPYGYFPSRRKKITTAIKYCTLFLAAIAMAFSVFPF